jgi:hypothetical protein
MDFLWRQGQSDVLSGKIAKWRHRARPQTSARKTPSQRGRESTCTSLQPTPRGRTKRRSGSIESRSKPFVAEHFGASRNWSRKSISTFRPPTNMHSRLSGPPRQNRSSLKSRDYVSVFPGRDTGFVCFLGDLSRESRMPLRSQIRSADGCAAGAGFGRRGCGGDGDFSSEVRFGCADQKRIGAEDDGCASHAESLLRIS